MPLLLFMIISISMIQILENNTKISLLSFNNRESVLLYFFTSVIREVFPNLIHSSVTEVNCAGRTKVQEFGRLVVVLSLVAGIVVEEVVVVTAAVR